MTSKKPPQSAFISYLVEEKCQRLECGTESTEAALQHVDLFNFFQKAPLLQIIGDERRIRKKKKLKTNRKTNSKTVFSCRQSDWKEWSQDY